MRIYDPRLGKFLSVDPLAKGYPELTPFQFASNRPIQGIDLDGEEFFLPQILFGYEMPILLSTEETIIPKPVFELAKIEEHHVIPKQAAPNEVVRSARDAGFKFEGKENKIEVEKFSRVTGKGQHGSHPKYTNEVLNRLAEFKEQQPTFTPKDALNFIRNTVKDLQNTIESNPSKKINDLFENTPLQNDNTKVVIPLRTLPSKKQENSEQQHTGQSYYN